MTRFRLFILLTYTAVLSGQLAPIQRYTALSPLLPAENQFFTARVRVYEGDDGYQPVEFR